MNSLQTSESGVYVMCVPSVYFGRNSEEERGRNDDDDDELKRKAVCRSGGFSDGEIECKKEKREQGIGRRTEKKIRG